jgi:uncharacterized protein YihD (DUF1040 family)
MRDLTPPGRAFTTAQKRELVERLLAAWQRSPHQRLGQFISNAAHAASHEGRSVDLFQVEDDLFALMVENFAKRVSEP